MEALPELSPDEKNTLRSGVRSAMCAASLLSGEGLTDVNDAPAFCFIWDFTSQSTAMVMSRRSVHLTTLLS